MNFLLFIPISLVFNIVGLFLHTYYIKFIRGEEVEILISKALNDELSDN